MTQPDNSEHETLAILRYRLTQVEVALKTFVDSLNETNKVITNMTRTFIEAQVCEKRVAEIEREHKELRKLVEDHESLVKLLTRFADWLTNKTTKRVVIGLLITWVATRPELAWLTEHLKTALAALS